MKKVFEKVAVSTILFGNTVMSSLANLDSTGKSTVIDTGGPKGGDLVTFAQNAINWAVGLIALIAVVILIISGVKYITSNGDEKKVEEAQKGIVNAIIGLVICFLAVLIVNFVIVTLLPTIKA
jgi:heme/copper-type cytochrome/quinol oxidase subunit 2